MNKIVLMAGLALLAQVATATDRSWGKVNDSYDGVYTDTAHWTGGVMPNGGDTAKFAVNASYTVTMPDGVCTNFANFWPAAYPGKAIVFDGLNGSFVHPQNPNDNYSWRSIMLSAGKNGGNSILYMVNNSTATYVSDPNLEFTNWKMTLSSDNDRHAKLVFDEGRYDFRNPCGLAYKYGSTMPAILFFDFGNATTTNSYALGEVEVKSGAAVHFPALTLQGHASSNVFAVIGGTVTAGDVRMAASVNGWGRVTDLPTVTDIVLDEGGTLAVSNKLYLGENSSIYDRTFRILSKGGSHFYTSQLGASSHNSDVTLMADGGVIEFGKTTVNQELTREDFAAVRLLAANGGEYILDQQGKGLKFGSDATAADSPRLYSADFDAARLTIKPSALWEVHGADLAFRNGSTVVNDGAFRFYGRKADVSTLVIDGSTVTNSNEFVIGYQHDAHMMLTNGATFVIATNVLNIGGTSSNVAGTHYGRLDIYDGDLVIDNTRAAALYTSRLSDYESEVNLHSGSIRYLNPNKYELSMDLAYGGPGVFNLYGGTVDVQNVRFAVSGSSGDAREAMVCIYGGEFRLTSTDQSAIGFSVGGAYSYGATTRRARVILNGGVLKSANVFGGMSAQCRNGTGYVAFEADGGVLTTPCDTKVLLRWFDEAKVGAKGLTIDSAGHTVSIAQSTWANKDGEEGRIVFTGEGVKTPTGDVSGVSYIVLAGGTTDLSNQTAVQNLVVTNGATLKLDPTKTLAATSLTLGDAQIELTSTLALGDVKTLLELTEPMSDASLAKLARTVVAVGVPSGKSYDLEQVENDGAYDVTITLREPQTTDVSLATGTETRTDDIFVKVADSITAQIGAGASLTLSGKLECGTFVKDGEGLLKLTNADNLFVPGFLLQSGGVSVSDFAALGIGPNTGALTVQNGVLEITGPAEGMDFTEKIAMTQQTTNDIFVVKNEVDVTMPVPGGTKKGEFLKRGAGKLTLTVEGATNPFTGGRGKGKIDANYNVWGGTLSSLVQLTFVETSGMVTSSGVPSFLVAEGELDIVGKGTGAAVQLSGIGCVGISTAVGSVQPGLVLDNVELNQNNYPDVWFYLGGGAGSQSRSDDFATAPYVILTNNATLRCSEFEVGHFMSGANCRPRLEVDGSFLSSANWFTPNAADDATFQPTVTFRNGSRLGTRRIRVTRDVTVDFDATEVANYEHGFAEPMVIDPIAQSTVYTATFNFRNGSRLYCSKVNTDTLNTSAYHPLTVSFDNSEWCLTNTTEGAFDFPHPDKIRIVAEAGGLKLPVLEGATWTMNHEVVGEGGLVNNGKGILKLDATTVGYTGATRAEAGATIDLGGLPQSITLAGPGTFQNGTLAAGSAIAYSADGTDVPTVSNVAFGGIVRVDLGRTTDDPLTEPFKTFTVLKYTGTAPDVSKLRLKGTGVKHVVGTFAAANGVVTCTPKFSGMTIFLR